MVTATVEEWTVQVCSAKASKQPSITAQWIQLHPHEAEIGLELPLSVNSKTDYELAEEQKTVAVG